MIHFLVQRLAWAAVVLWLVLSATFVLTYVMPIDPALAMVGPHADSDTVERVRRQMCLDRPFAVQYGCYVGQVLQGELGTSYRLQRPVRALIAERIGPTAQLGLAAFTLQLLLGVPLGIMAALRRNRAADHVAQAASALGQSLPAFFIGPALMYLLGYRWELFPVSGYGEAGLDRLWHLCLPALTVATTGVALYSRLIRSDLLEALDADFVRTARAKGLSPGRVVIGHALRYAVLPVITLAGLELGILLGGEVVTEQVFGWPGLGREAIQGILNVDLPVVLGIVLLSAVTVVGANLLTDVVCCLLDPRLREPG